MVVIYTQEKTYLYKTLESAQQALLDIYGNKLGTEAYNSLESGPFGKTYRKNGGPLVKIITEEEAELIKAKEKSIGMMN